MPWGMPPFGPADAALVVLMPVATDTDLRTRKIKNWLTFPTLLLGLALAPLHLDPAWRGLAGAGVELLCCPPFYAVGPVLSADDVKMLMAAGALLGPGGAIRAKLFSVALNLPIGLVYLVATGRLGKVSEVVNGKAPPPMLPHGPVISAAILLARLQPWPGP